MVGVFPYRIAQQEARQFARHGRGERWALTLAACLVIVQVAAWVAGISLRSGPSAYVRVSTDLLAILTGAQVIRDGDGHHLYDLEVQRAAQQRILTPELAVHDDTILVYVHPPIEALLVAPLLQLPYPLIYALWDGIVLLAFFLAMRVLHGALPLQPPVRWVVIATFCASIPFHRTLWLAQTSPIVFLGLCGAYAALRQRKESLAGVWLTLVALKPQLLPFFVLLLLLLGNWRALLTMFSLVGSACLALMPILGVAWPWHYIAMIAEESRWGAERGEYPEIMHVWRGLVTNLFGEWIPSLLTPLYMSLALCSMLLFVGVWWRVRNRLSGGCGEVGAETEQRLRTDLLWALACIVGVLLPNHLYLHDLMPLLLTAWIIAAYATTDTWPVPLSRLFLGLLWANHAALILTLISGGNPAIAVVPSVLLLAALAVLLGARIMSRDTVDAATPQATA